MSRAASLLQLQAVDSELDAHRARLRVIQAELGDTPALRNAQRSLLEAQAQLQAARVAVQNLEYDSGVLNEKIAEISERMYSGGVSHPKQLQDLEKDLDSLKRRRAGLEDKQFEALLAAEAAEIRHKALQHDLEQAETEAARSNGSLVEERARHEASVRRLTTQREALLTSVAPGDLELYERLRVSKKGRAVTAMADGVCVSCGVAPSSSRVQTARQGNELILCGNCGRILCAD